MSAITDQLTVVIADDHPPTRAGVRASLEDGGFIVCAEVGNAKAAIEAALEHKPDICLLDIHMPGSGINAARQIAAALADTAVVMLTVSRDDDDLFDALRAGASGYLLKDTDPDRLPAALMGVLRGEAAIPRALIPRLLEEFRGKARHRTVPLAGRRGVKLTSREWEVLELLRERLDTETIAKRLFVSPVTVRTHISSVLKKLNVPDREAAIKLLEDQT